MALYAIADLHLSFGVNKPMSIFGSHWHNHELFIAEHWRAVVQPEDTVLIPGDISWAMTLEQAMPDLAWLETLPGTKILLRGNHDYWWSSLAKIEAFCREQGFASLRFLRNNSFTVGDVLVCGTRGWLLPGDPEFSASDEKIYLREAGRLQLSLEDAAQRRKPGQSLVACLHYPPFSRADESNLLTDLLVEFSVDLCLYGHIHGMVPGSQRPAPPGPVQYRLIAADALAFKPLCIFCCAGNGLVI